MDSTGPQVNGSVARPRIGVLIDTGKACCGVGRRGRCYLIRDHGALSSEAVAPCGQLPITPACPLKLLFWERRDSAVCNR